MRRARSRCITARSGVRNRQAPWLRWISWSSGLALGGVLAIVAAARPPAPDAEVWIVLSENGGVYQQVADGIEAVFAAGDAARPALRTLTRDEFPGAVAGSPPARLIVSVGVDAARVSATERGVPRLFTLLPKSSYNALTAGATGKAAAVSAVYLDQPPARLLRLIRLGLPEARRVAMLFGPASAGQLLDFEAAARDHGLTLQAVTLTGERQLFGALTRALEGADVLLAVPDPRVFNRHTAQNILLETYRRRIPVIGYSEAYIEAGALLSLYSTPEQIGRQAGEWIAAAVRAPGTRAPAASYPKYFTVRSNRRVARSLALELPADSLLVRRLGAAPENTP
jgi:putative tryptophan/tyrosine transport system substrate-binding protein